VRVSRYRDLIVGVVLLTVSVIYYWLSLSIAEAGVTQMGPKFVPQVIAGLTFVLSIILVVNSLQTLRRQAAADAEADKRPSEDTVGEEDPAEDSRYGPVILTGILLLIYVVALESAGFVLATAVYLFLQFNVAAPKTRKAPKYQAYYLVGSIAAALIINYTFRDGFNVMLPEGLLG
jgi:hypothetical protein